MDGWGKCFGMIASYLVTQWVKGCLIMRGAFGSSRASSMVSAGCSQGKFVGVLHVESHPVVCSQDAIVPVVEFE
jgi:hypothetical protein